MKLITSIHVTAREFLPEIVSAGIMARVRGESRQELNPSVGPILPSGNPNSTVNIINFAVN
jgi:hypothetical protein